APVSFDAKPALSGRGCDGTPQSGCSYNASIRVAPQVNACPYIGQAFLLFENQLSSSKISIKREEF
ncbi:MAG TPA: hypothetical protein PK423_09660, partial [Clostridiales bacterium]|nr:hypothetical protein [Clostridiales bacterium]